MKYLVAVLVVVLVATAAVGQTVQENCPPGNAVDFSESNCWFVAPGGSGSGTRASPMGSLTSAVAAVTAGRPHICMRDGTYSSQAAFSWPDGTGIYGGFDAAYTSRGGITIINFASTTNPLATMSGDANYCNVLNQVHFIGVASPYGATTTSGSVAGNAVGIFATNSHLRLAGARILVGNGANGAAGSATGGAAPSTGAGGLDGARGATNAGPDYRCNPHDCSCGLYSCNTCYDCCASGGSPSSGSGGSLGCSGGTTFGGTGGSGRKGTIAGLSGNTGANAQQGGGGGSSGSGLGFNGGGSIAIGGGNMGGNGGGGSIGSTASYTLASARYGTSGLAVDLGTNGATGSYAAGGGGGGGGGGCAGNQCGSAWGASGAGGGSGGCGGTGGRGGRSGGGSFAIYAVNSEISIQASNIDPGSGGSGGAAEGGGGGGGGGSPGIGGPTGNHGFTGSLWGSCSGSARGGYGGTGGSGGTGSAGRGGPSIGVLLHGSSSLYNGPSNTFVPNGAASPGGSGSESADFCKTNGGWSCEVTTNQPDVFFVSPTTVYGGYRVAINGVKFQSGTLSVKIGDLTCAGVNVVSDALLFCTVPVTTDFVGAAAVRVSVNYLLSSAYTINYMTQPILSTVVPGGARSGDRITVTGSNFGNNDDIVTVRVDGSSCGSIQWITPGSVLTCVLPLHAAPATVNVIVDVTQTLPSGESSPPTPKVTSSNTRTFQYIVKPVVTGRSPAFAGEGDVVTVDGTSFGALANMRGFIGNLECIVNSVSGGTQLQMTIPNGQSILTSGFYNIKVQNFLTASDPASDRIEIDFVPKPTVDELQPAGGAINTILTITGTNFGRTEGDLTVLIGGVGCPVVTNSLLATGTQFKCTVQNTVQGNLPVQLSVKTQTATTTPTWGVVTGVTNVVVIDPTPVIEGVVGTPVVMSVVNGGTDGGIIRVEFGGIRGVYGSGAVANCNLRSPTEINCTAPVGVPGIAVITVFKYQIPDDSAAVFTYITGTGNPPVIAGTTPYGVQQYSQVTITGGNFIDINAITLSPAGSGSTSCTEVSGTLNSAGTKFECVIQGTWPADTILAISVGSSSGGTSQPYTNAFKFLQAPDLIEISPYGGQSGDRLTVTGTNLGTDVGEMKVRLGTSLSECNIISGSLKAISGGRQSIECFIPPMAEGGHRVYFYYFGIQAGGNILIYTVVSPPLITSISPGGGRAATRLTLHGDAFGNDELALTVTLTNATFSTGCDVDSGSLNFGGTRLSCTVPSMFAGPYSVRLLKWGAVVSLPSIPPIFQYINQPSLSSVTPPGGLFGTEITLRGENLGTNEEAMTITVGGSLCTIERGSLNAIGTVVKCTTPTGAIGAATVALNNFGIDSSNTRLFTYIVPPVVSAISPQGGLSGTVVTLTGTNLGVTEADISIRLGGAQCTIVPGTLVKAATDSIQCTVPVSGVIGQVLVELFNFGVPAQFGQLTTYEYIPVPSLALVNPVGGTSSENIRITGTGLGNDETDLVIRVDGTLCPVVTGTLNSQGTSVECTTPPKAVGSYAITLVRYTIPATGSLSFEYVSTPTITDIEPRGGQAGDHLTIFGTNFGAQSSENTVTVGSVACTVTESVPSRVICAVGSATLGLHNVVVKRFSVPSTGSFQFLFIQPPSISSISPVGGMGDTEVTIRGLGFGLETEFSVEIGGYPCSVPAGGVNVDGSVARCRTAINMPVGTYDLIGYRFGVPSVAPHKDFEIILPPVILSVNPIGGQRGQTIEVAAKRGVDQDVASSIEVTIGGSSATILSWSTASGITTFSVVVPIPLFYMIDDGNGTAVFFAVDDPAQLNRASAVHVRRYGVPSVINETSTKNHNFEPFDFIPLSFSFVEAPSVHPDVVPKGGSMQPYGADHITVRGINMRCETCVSVEMSNGLGETRACPIVPGSFRVSAFVENITVYDEVECYSPNFIDLNSKSARLTVRVFGVPAAVRPEYLLVPPDLTVTAVAPGGATSGAVLTISGARFGVVEEYLSVTIVNATGGVSVNCPIIVGSLNTLGNRLECVIPPTLHNTLPFRRRYQVEVKVFNVRNNNWNAVVSGFDFIDLPVIRDAYPRGAKAGDGLTIYGQNFWMTAGTAGTCNDCIKVIFNDGTFCPVDAVLPAATPCNDALCSNGGSLDRVVCSLPDEIDLSQGAVSVRVQVFQTKSVPQSQGGDVSLLDQGDNLFTFVNSNPFVTGVEPGGGKAGDILTVFGNNFINSDITPFPGSRRQGLGDPVDIMSVLLCRQTDDGEDCFSCPFVEGSTGEVDERTSLECVIPLLNETGFYRAVVDVFNVKSTQNENIVYYERLEFIRWSDPIAAGFTFMVVVTCISLVLFGLAIFRFRNNPIMVAITPMFCYIILFASGLLATSVLTFIGKPNSTNCTIRTWFPNMALVLIFSLLLLKMWRIFKIFENKNMRRVIIPNRQIMERFAVMVGLEVAGLAFETLVTPKVGVIHYDNPAYMTCENRDGTRFSFTMSGLLIYSFVIIAGGVYLSYRTRNVTGRYNESKHIGFTIYNACVFMFITFVIYLFSGVRDNSDTYFGVLSVCALGIVWGTILVLFAPRIYGCYTGDEDLRGGEAGTWSASKKTTISSSNSFASASMDSFGESLNMAGPSTDDLFGGHGGAGGGGGLGAPSTGNTTTGSSSDQGGATVTAEDASWWD